MTKIRSRGTSRVRDRRGSRGGTGGFGGGGFPIPMKAGGGILGVVVLVVFVLIQQFGSDGGGGTPTDERSGEEAGSVACTTEIERVVCGAVDDVSRYWEDQYPRSFQGAYAGTDTVFFSGATTTGCGRASAQGGPFYCPADQLVYFDLDFLEQLQADFGATGDLAAQYIVAHEYGHHVQNITGIADRSRAAQRSAGGSGNEFSVALELQADCFAGAWVRSVDDRGLLDDAAEIGEALNAAEAVGDDRIMESSGLEVDPESFTHGSAEQRREWLEVGFDTGDPEACTTFDGSLAP